MAKLDNKNISKHLGQVSQYKSEYDPKLLVREPRSSNRKHLGIKQSNLPFVGCDVWNGYEVSALVNNGVPVCAVAKVIYPSDSKYIVESKSMKLYWNSFNMTHMGDTFEEVYSKLENTAANDLSEYLKTDVRVKVFPCGTDVSSVRYPYVEDNWIRLEQSSRISSDSYYINVYSENPTLLETKILNRDPYHTKYMSSLLKSNCRVTSQPDWGDVFITMSGKYLPEESELLSYIVSFRDECHFHEEICETIYSRLLDIFEPDELSVACLYARRGGWDINPIRATHEHLIEDFFWEEDIPWVKTLRQ